MGWFSFLKPAGDIVNNLVAKPIADWSERKTIKAKSKTFIAERRALVEVTKVEAELERAKNGQIIEADYDKTAQENMKFTWKDEALLIIIFAPAVMCFIPPLQEFAKEGFLILNGLPLWYVILIVSITASVFGLRWAVAPLINRWSNKKKEENIQHRASAPPS